MNPLPYGDKAFGDEQYKNNTSAFSVSARYTGQVLDQDTGLYYYGARYYDPQLARFIHPDSVVPEENSSQALNRYSYCINNPLKFTDPTGQGFFLAIATFLGFKSVGAMVTAIVVAAAVGAGLAAATGGNVLKGALAGAIGGMFGVGFNPVRIIAGGAIGALVTGGDPMMGALSAGIAAGVGACFEGSPLPGVFGDVENDYFSALMFSTASGALCGGVTAEIFGGDFGSGAAFGAAGAAAGFVVSKALEDFHFGPMGEKAYGDPAYLTVRRTDPRTGKSYSYTVKLNEVKDFVYEILKSNVTGEKIEFMRFEGHGLGKDAEAMRGEGLVMGKEVLHVGGSDPGIYSIGRLIKTGALAKAFLPDATIELASCWSAHRKYGGMNSIADAFKRTLPGARVYGYTTDTWAIGIGKHRWYFTGRLTEVKQNR